MFQGEMVGYSLCKASRFSPTQAHLFSLSLLDSGFLCELVLRLRPVLFSPGDYICRKGGCHFTRKMEKSTLIFMRDFFLFSDLLNVVKHKFYAVSSTPVLPIPPCPDCAVFLQFMRYLEYQRAILKNPNLFFFFQIYEVLNGGI